MGAFVDRWARWGEGKYDLRPGAINQVSSLAEGALLQEIATSLRRECERTKEEGLRVVASSQSEVYYEAYLELRRLVQFLDTQYPGEYGGKHGKAVDAVMTLLTPRQPDYY